MKETKNFKILAIEVIQSVAKNKLSFVVDNDPRREVTIFTILENIPQFSLKHL